MKKLKILMLFDYPFDPPDKKYSAHIPEADWKTEKDVLDALIKLGHDVVPFHIFNRISPLVARLRRHRPDVVFNMVHLLFDGITVHGTIEASINYIQK